MTRSNASKPSVRAKGFTLIELLVVIAIVTIILSVLLPALSAAREYGQETKCRAQMRGLAAAFMAYANSNDDYLCSGSFDPDVANGRDGPVDAVGWVADLVNSKQAEPAAMLCPSNPARHNQKLAYYNPADIASLVARGYDTNLTQSWYMARTEWNPGNTSSSRTNLKRVDTTFGGLNQSSLKHVDTSRVPLVGDGRTDIDEIMIMGTRAVKTMSDGPLGGPYGIQSYSDFGPAHGRGSWIGNDKKHNRIRANIVFADGHVGFFEDRDRDGEFGIDRSTRPESQRDLDGDVFDGVLSIGRRSLEARALR